MGRTVGKRRVRTNNKQLLMPVVNAIPGMDEQAARLVGSEVVADDNLNKSAEQAIKDLDLTPAEKRFLNG